MGRTARGIVGWKAALPTLVGVWAGAAALPAGFAVAPVEERGAALAAWIGLGFVVAPFFALLASGQERLRARVAIGAGILGVAPLAWFGAVFVWNRPLVALHWVCGTPAASLMVIGPLMAAALAATSTGLGLGLARLGGRGGWIAVPLLAAALVWSGWTLARTAPRLAAPGAEAWVETRPELTRLEPIGGELHDGTRTQRITTDVGLERACRIQGEGEWRRAYCELRLRRLAGAGAIGADAPPCERQPTGCGPVHAFGTSPDATLVVRHDAASALWLVEEVDRFPTTRAFDAALSPRAILPSDLGARIAPPRSWWALAALGLLLALATLARRAWLTARLRGWRHARVGRVDDGDVVFDDGELPRRGALAHPVPTGPALAIPLGPAGAPTYRDDGSRSAWAVEPGTADAIRSRHRLALLGWDLLALAFVVLTTVPLWVAG